MGSNRDPARAQGRRAATIGSLLGLLLAGLVAGLAVLLLLDGVLAALNADRFGQANGWLAAVLPVWLLVEEFRAWRGQPGRLLAALAGGTVGVCAGGLASGLASDLPPVASGAVGAAVALLAYSYIWFYGVRWLSAR